jgi:hypothetical protein
MFKLSEETKNNIQKDTGIPINEMLSMSATSIDIKIEKKIGKKLTLKQTNNSRSKSRGSVYLFLNRLLHMGNIDKKLSKI